MRNIRNILIKNEIFFYVYRFFRSMYFRYMNMVISHKYCSVKSNKHKIIIGGWFGKRFADNSKALYLYLSQNKGKYNLEKVIYATRSIEIYEELCKQGFDTVLIGTKKSIFEHLTSGIHIIDNHYTDLDAYYSIFAKRVDLWHGFAVKKIGLFDSNYSFSIKLNEAILMVKNSIKPGNWQERYLLSTSVWQKSIHMLSFGCPENKTIIGTYPRDYYMLVV